MKLLSVNVGTPRQVDWNGRQVRTAIFKHPVDGPRFVGRLNVEGDEQADLAAHGGEHRAVFVYQIESYRYWQEQLGRDDFSYGQFGENFTVDGLADDEVCIGDRYRIGTRAVRGHPAARDVLPRRHPHGRTADAVAARRRTAAPASTCGCCEEGDGRGRRRDRAGRRRPRGHDRRRDRRAALPAGPSRRELDRALRIPALSQGWQGSFARAARPGARTGATAAPGLTPRRGPGSAPLRVARDRPESAERDLDRARPGRLRGRCRRPRPGQFLTIRLRPGPDEPPLTRSYSLSGPPNAGSYRISVKREPTASPAATCTPPLGVGDMIEVAAPRGIVRAPARRAAGGPDQCRGRRHAGARHAARARGAGLAAGDLVAARRPQPRRALVPRRGAPTCSARSRTRTGSSATAPPGRPTVPAATSTSPGASPGRARPGRGAGRGRLLPVRASPVRQRSQRDLVSRGVTPDRIRAETFGPTAPITPGVRGGSSNAHRTRRPGHPGSARWSRSAAATSRSTGIRRSAACSNSPRRATCPAVSAAGRASAIAAPAA